MFSINYKKNKNSKLFKDLENKKLCDLEKIQNYVPIYNKFFDLQITTHNNFNLNHKFSINGIINKETYNKYEINVLDDKNKSYNKNSFFKFSGLLDPTKYMSGKYKNYKKELTTKLPSYKMTEEHIKKINDENNMAYVDSFFSYLSSQLLNKHDFIHGIDFYGSFIGVQRNFQLNIIDDIEYLNESKFFHKNKGKLFETDDYQDDMSSIGNNSKNNKKKLKIDKKEEIDDITEQIRIDTIDEEIYSGKFEDYEILTEKNLKILNGQNNNIEEFKYKNTKSETSRSSCSSRSSNTQREEDDDDELDNCSNSDLSNYSSIETEKPLMGYVYDFPIQMICLEKLDQTLDSLIELEEKDEDVEELSDKEWKSILFQIIMILVTYQKVFKFTHNDLHTNNIMYNKTDRKFLFYRFNEKYYKVPTFGRIFKIIDFGRAIYTYKDKICCSDSFHRKGDAATQYNCEPYYNDNKPYIQPNPGFDLCRLSCSLFDYFFENIKDVKDEASEVALLINEWCLDDTGRNILYKNNGEERYPEFKLYKMIARKVHKHIPHKQVDNGIFFEYISNRKKMPKNKNKIMNIDILQDCTKDY
jgi:hypothetical protein